MEKMMSKPICVADIDFLFPSYKVLTEKGEELGRKSANFGYLRNPTGPFVRRPVTKSEGIEALLFKGDPPWFNSIVIKIDQHCAEITIHIKQVLV